MFIIRYCYFRVFICTYFSIVVCSYPSPTKEVTFLENADELRKTELGKLGIRRTAAAVNAHQVPKEVRSFSKHSSKWYSYFTQNIRSQDVSTRRYISGGWKSSFGGCWSPASRKCGGLGLDATGFCVDVQINHHWFLNEVSQWQNWAWVKAENRGYLKFAFGQWLFYLNEIKNELTLKRMLICRKKCIRYIDRCREVVIADRNKKPRTSHEEI
jgi:hypothetical protein